MAPGGTDFEPARDAPRLFGHFGLVGIDVSGGMIVARTGNNPTVMAAAKPEETPEGKIEAVGWCEGNEGTLICLLGQEEEIKDLPESKNAPR